MAKPVPADAERDELFEILHGVLDASRTLTQTVLEAARELLDARPDRPEDKQRVQRVRDMTIAALKAAVAALLLIPEVPRPEDK